MDKSMNIKENNGRGGNEEEMTLEDALREQEELAGVDTSIEETIEAMRSGREDVAQRFYRQNANQNKQSDGSNQPLDMLRTGRQRILEKITSRTNSRQTNTVDETEPDNEGIKFLNRQLTEKLDELTRNIPQDPNHRKAVEAEIHAAVKTYLMSLHKILNPIRFSRESLQTRS